MAEEATRKFIENYRDEDYQDNLLILGEPKRNQNYSLSVTRFETYSLKIIIYYLRQTYIPVLEYYIYIFVSSGDQELKSELSVKKEENEDYSESGCSGGKIIT